MSTDTGRVYGPSALGGDIRRFIELTTTLARSEFKLRYFGSVLGYVWSLMRPLLFFGVLYLFFTQVIQLGKNIPHYGVYLLTGIVLWNFLGEATNGCVNCLVTRESLLRKVRFPQMVVPLSVSLTATFNLALNCLVVVVFALLNGVTPTVRWLEMIPIVLAFVVLATGLGMLLSALYVRFRDVQPIWEVLFQAWFYCSPIMYLAYQYNKRFSTGFERIALLNPVATLLTQMGHSLIGNTFGPLSPKSGWFPGAATAGRGYLVPITAIALIFALFALGWWIFTREAPRVAENL
jgi:ABC-2 type transport system permease protein